MSSEKRKTITVVTSIPLSSKKVWELWTNPVHIIHWNFASPDWHCPSAKNEIRAGGKFSWRMEARDGSMGFDFSGVYEEVEPEKRIVYRMDDGRKASISFTSKQNEIEISENFEAENSHSLEQQRAGWQAILDNFRKYSLAQNGQKPGS